MRFTIAQCMAATAVLRLNIGLARAYLFAEKGGGHLDLVDSGFLMLFALQFGLWRYLNTAGRRRWFWLGFEVCGLSATLILLSLFMFNINLLDRYEGAMSDLFYLCLPRRVDGILSTEHWDWFLAIIYFLPELLAAALGGLPAACFFKATVERLGSIRPAAAAHASPSRSQERN